jgi:acyl-CoA synthetase (AMP-forming)/AMP-acid ligase II
MSTVSARVLEVLASQRGRVVLTGRFGSLTAGELHDLVCRYADGLTQTGVIPGVSIGISGRPGPRTFAALLAATGIGARAVLLDPRMGHEVTEAHTRAAGIEVLAAEPLLWRLQRFLPAVARRRSLLLPPVRTRLTIGNNWGTGAISIEGAGTAVHRLDDHPGDRDALMIFTSGTTAAPQGVIHSHESILAGVDAVRALIQPRAGSTICGAQFFVLLPALCAGACVHVLDASSARAAQEIAEMRPEVTYLTPTVLREVLDAGRGPFTGRVYTGSAPISTTLLTRAKAAGFTQAWDVYALTEAFPVAAVEEAEKRAWEQANPDAGIYLGALAPGVSGRTSNDGELQLSGGNIARAYLGADGTRHGIEWLSTGDLGRIENGGVVLAGRIKDMFITRAENIYPSLYEPRFRIDGVRDAVLVGLGPNADDQTPVLVVQTDGTVPESTLRRTLREAGAVCGLARPAHLVFAEIPRSGRNNKIDRAETARLAVTKLAGQGINI